MFCVKVFWIQSHVLYFEALNVLNHCNWIQNKMNVGILNVQGSETVL